jgi:hypothetical protein
MSLAQCAADVRRIASRFCFRVSATSGSPPSPILETVCGYARARARTPVTFAILMSGRQGAEALDAAHRATARGHRRFGDRRGPVEPGAGAGLIRIDTGGRGGSIRGGGIRFIGTPPKECLHLRAPSLAHPHEAWSRLLPRSTGVRVVPEQRGHDDAPLRKNPISPGCRLP